MPLPDFDEKEQYVIHWMKAHKSAEVNPCMWAYLVTGALLFGFGAYYSNVAFMACAFIVVCGFRLYEEWYQARWQPTFRSIILKYESALSVQRSSPAERTG